MTKYIILIIVLLGSLAMLAGESKNAAKEQALPVCKSASAQSADSTKADPARLILLHKLWGI